MKFLILLTIFFLSNTILYSQDFRYGKVSAEELNEKVHPLYPEANAAILYREVKTSFNYSEDDGFTILTEVFERIKIYNSEGFSWGNKEIELYKGSAKKEEIKYEKAEIYNLNASGKVISEKMRRDGKFTEEKSRYKDVVKLVMPNVKEGSVIEYSYSVLSPFINNIDDYILQFSIPANVINVTFLAPEYLHYKIHQTGWININLTQTKSPRTINYNYTSAVGQRFGGTIPVTSLEALTFDEYIYTISQKNIPALDKEPLSGNIDRYRSAVSFELESTKFPRSPITYYSLTWEDVVKQIYNSSSFGQELNKSNYYKNDLDALPLTGKTPAEKINIIYDFVQKKMVWNNIVGIYSDKGVTNAYKEQSGNVADINFILTAMLSASGLDANPVLISTKSNTIPLFPTTKGFNYVIASVTINDEVVLLDASGKNLIPNLLREETLNWQGRIVRRNGNSNWIPLHRNKRAIESTMANLEMSTDFQLNGSIRKQYTDYHALRYRQNFKNLIIDDIIKNIEKNASIIVSDLNIQNMDNLYEPVSETYSLNALNQVENIGEKVFFTPLLFLTTKENLFKSNDRKYPVDISFPTENRYTISIKIPENYKVDVLPENLNLMMSEGMGDFRYLISANGTQIQILVIQTLNQSLIRTDFYPQLKSFYQSITDKLNEKIVLVKT